MAKKSLLDKVKDWAVIIALLMSGITGKISYDNHGLKIEVEKKEKQLAEAEANNFSLSSVCE
jgi:hypothetical protein